MLRPELLKDEDDYWYKSIDRLMSVVGAVRIALVDDHQILMDSMEALLSLNEQFEVCVKENHGRDFLNRSDLHTLDIILMDINMRDMDGLEVLKEFQSRGYPGHCIFLSSYDDLHLVNEAMLAGARGYVTKSSAGEYLEEAIYLIRQGQIYYSPDIRDRILRAFDSSGRNTEDP